MKQLVMARARLFTRQAPRTHAAALVVLAVLAGCGRGHEQSSAEAARADSSAAGYTVGPRADSVGTAGDPARPVVLAATPNGGRPVLSPATVPAAAASRPGTTSAIAAAVTGPANGKPPGKPPAATADTMHVATVAKQPPPNVATKRPRVDSVAPAPSGPVRVNEFLTYDARSHTVSLQLIAGYNGLNGSLNYNGATNGSHGISVPEGWRIHVAVANRDSDLQHSAIVVREVLPPPIEPTNPAFSGAALPQLDEGLHEDETGTLDFVADHAGRFMIACGVAGHAQAGMWLQLAVVKDAVAPAYR